eukprot:TRINITY_DN2752_c0_g1_i1.p1 TRINITY_DN2752_c0_g1~~TRINITY_DN2752_c0_g1_i1.p1  ORF type:complete len:634 (-),score=192.24 TRINITY_DN2752_c0_g1_i1:1662-3563(-)
MAVVKLPFSLHETQEKEGFLMKRGGAFGSTYQKRWFILYGTELYYFKARPKGGKGECNGLINLGDAELCEDEDPGTPFSFCIKQKVPQPRDFWLKADQKLQKKEWLLALAQKMKTTGSSTVPEMKQLKMTHDDVITGIKQMYFEKMLDIEGKFNYEEFFSPPLKRSDFEAKPMILLIGQYSVGKTSFIEYLIKRSFPGSRVGPEPTTDRFVAVMHGDEDRIIPGNALSVDQDKPFTTTNMFGTGFLSKFEGAMTSSDLLKKVTLIDTPGILSGEKQRLGREYEFSSVVKWFAQQCDAILLLFDAHKLDISDELKDAILALKGNDDKIRVVLNKADSISTQALVRVYGSLMWSLGKVINTPEVVRVYIGSFWDKPYKNVENEKLFRAEQQDLLDTLNTLPRNSTVRKVNELVKRARTLRAHILVLNHLKKQMPMIGKDKKQKELIANLAEEYKEISKASKVPLGDFPPTSIYEKLLPEKDFTKFSSLSEKMMLLMEEILNRDLPNYMNMAAPTSGGDDDDDEFNPFGDEAENGWGIPSDLQEEFSAQWSSLSPSDEPLTGGQLRQPLMDSKAPQDALKKIWTLSDIGKTGKLGKEEFILAMYLARMAANGQPVPGTLPEELIPPSRRKETLFTQ